LSKAIDKAGGGHQDAICTINWRSQRTFIKPYATGMVIARSAIEQRYDEWLVLPNACPVTLMSKTLLVRHVPVFLSLDVIREFFAHYGSEDARLPGGKLVRDAPIHNICIIPKR
jgi:hypothetical protein